MEVLEDEPQNPGDRDTPPPPALEAEAIIQENEQAEGMWSDEEDEEVILNPQRREPSPPPLPGRVKVPYPGRVMPQEAQRCAVGPPPIGLAPPLMRVAGEPFDGTTDLEDYLVYYDQLSVVNQWQPGVKAMMLGLLLRGSARTVLAGLSADQRGNYHEVVKALRQNFAPVQQVQTYLHELKARKRKAGESLAVLGRDIGRLVRLAYPGVDQVTRETLGINALMDAFPDAAIEIRLHILRGQPETLQGAVALAMEVDAVMEASRPKPLARRTNVLMVGGEEEDEDEPRPPPKKAKVKPAQSPSAKQLEEMAGAFKRMEAKLQSLERGLNRKPRDKSQVKCFNCGKVGHYRRECRSPPKDQNQGNEEGRADLH